LDFSPPHPQSLWFSGCRLKLFWRGIAKKSKPVVCLRAPFEFLHVLNRVRQALRFAALRFSRYTCVFSSLPSASLRVERNARYFPSGDQRA